MYASIGDGGCDYAGDSGCGGANDAILGLFGTPAGNVTVASGFAVGTSDLVIDVTGVVAVGGADGRAQQRVIDHIPEGDLVLKIRQLGLEGDESRTDGDPGLELDEDV